MKARDLFLFFTVCVLVGTENLVVKSVLPYVGPLFFSAVRALLGGGLLLAFSRMSSPWPYLRPRHYARLTIMGFFFIFAGSALTNLGLKLSSSLTLANIILQSGAIFGAIFGTLFLGEKLGVGGALATSITFLGILIATWSGSNFCVGDLQITSIIFLVLGTAGWPIYNVLSKGLRFMTAGYLVGLSAIFGGSITLIGSISLEEKDQFSKAFELISNHPMHALPFLYSGPLVVALSTTIWHSLFSRYPLSRLMLGAPLISMIMVCESALIRGEYLSAQQVIGFSILLIGLLSRSLTWRTKNPHHQIRIPSTNRELN